MGMASSDELRKQVESLRQVNTSLQREILDNNAHLSRLHETTASLARFSNSSTPQSGSIHSGSGGSSPHLSRQPINVGAQGNRCQSNSGGSSPRVSRQPVNVVSQGDRCQSNSGGSSPKVTRQQAGHIFSQIMQNNSATNHMPHSQNQSQGFQQRVTANQAGFVSRVQQETAVSHLARLQDNPASQDNSSYEGGDMSQNYTNESMEGEHMATLGKNYFECLINFYTCASLLFS